MLVDSALVEEAFEEHGHVDVVVVVTKVAIEGVPEERHKGLGLLMLVLVFVGAFAEVEAQRLDLSGLEPVAEVADFRRLNADGAFGMLQRVTSNGFLFEALQGFVLVVLMQAIADVFQEVRLTRAEIAGHPDAILTVFPLLDSGKDFIHLLDDVVGEHIFLDFDTSRFRVDVLHINGWVNITGNVFLVDLL